MDFVPVAGFVTGTLFFEREPEEAPPWKLLAGFGAGLMLFAFIFVQIRSSLSETSGSGLLKRWTMFPASIEYVLVTLGMALLLFSLGHRWIDRNPRFNTKGRVSTVAKTFSRHSLSIYLLHHVVHLWPLWIIGAFTGAEPTWLWRQAIAVEWSIALSVIFLIGCYGLFRWVDRTNRRGIEGWMRSVCDRN